MTKSYTLAIADNPCVIRRDSHRVEGDAVIGFSFTIKPLTALTDDIECSMVGLGGFDDARLRAMLNTLCNAYSPSQVVSAVHNWLREVVR